eukprot:SM000162S02355  [mRNA]  locus=s162:21959:27343:- [translate_table: standard]
MASAEAAAPDEAPGDEAAASSESTFAVEDALMLAITFGHIVAAPYTKVEESFNVQAMHDLLYYRTLLTKPSLFLTQYDHFAFPGVVPRTFIGAMVVSFLSAPLVAAIQALNLPKLFSLYAVRLVQGALLVASFSRLRRQVAKKFGVPAGRAFALVTASQFHLLYYCSRPLPNSFALGIANLAYAFWLQGRVRVTLSLLVLGMTVFRCDLLILLGPIDTFNHPVESCRLLYGGRAHEPGCDCDDRFLHVAEMVVARGASAVVQHGSGPQFGVGGVTGALVLHFRTAEVAVGSSASGSCEYVQHDPLVGMLVERKLWQYIIPAVAFLVLYSKLPHKVFADLVACELRFILPALPLYNMAAAVAVAKSFAERRASRSRGLLWAACGGLLLASWAVAQVLAIASYLNYPGGQASGILHDMGGGGTHDDLLGRSVHVSVLPAMTGFSRFCERGPPWKYSKEEGIPLQNLVQHNFTFLLSDKAAVPGFGCLATVAGFSRLELRRSFPPLSYVLLPKVFIHKRLRDEGPVEPSARATYELSVSQVVFRELMTTSLVLVGGGVLLTRLNGQATKPKLKPG